MLARSCTQENQSGQTAMVIKSWKIRRERTSRGHPLPKGRISFIQIIPDIYFSSLFIKIFSDGHPVTSLNNLLHHLMVPNILNIALPQAYYFLS